MASFSDGSDKPSDSITVVSMDYQLIRYSSGTSLQQEVNFHKT